MGRYNLTDSQKDLLRWLVEKARASEIGEEFEVVWYDEMGGFIIDYNEKAPKITPGALDAFAVADLMLCAVNYRASHAGSEETSRRCTLLQGAFEAVDSNFAASDTSYVRYVTPLSELTHLDDQILTRCLPSLSVGAADPRMWDTAVRTAVVILEDRLRNVGGIDNPMRCGRDLVNDVFARKGTLAHKFDYDEDREAHRDLFAGIVGMCRNPFAHHLVDPTPESGGALIVAVNLLLKILEDLRER